MGINRAAWRGDKDAILEYLHSGMRVGVHNDHYRKTD